MVADILAVTYNCEGVVHVYCFVPTQTAQHIPKTFQQYSDERSEGSENIVNVRLGWNIPMEASWHIQRFKRICNQRAL